MDTIHIYTDGACSGNPGRGGYGAVLKCGAHTKELSGSFRKTTNNRMELMAAIAALEAVRKEGSSIVLTSDSRYLTDAFNKGWLEGWKRNGYSKILNPDLWKRLAALTERHDVTFMWVKGHAGHPENERCDALAVEAYTKGATAADREYEESPACLADRLEPLEILAGEFGEEAAERILSCLRRGGMEVTRKS